MAPSACSALGLVLGLAACGGGGAGRAPAAPRIANLTLAPTAVYASSTPVTFSATFDFVDPDGDLASANLVVTDSLGAETGRQSTPILQANGVTSAQIGGSATAVLATAGIFTAHLQLVDRGGLLSNELTADITVRDFPWTTGAANPQPVWNPAVTALRNLVFVIGGERSDLFTQGPAIARCSAYDPVLDGWLALPPMPTARVGLTAVAAGGRLYAIGGATTPVHLPIGAVSNVVEEFDPQTLSWRVRAPMPTARAHAAAAELDGRIIVAGGDLQDGYQYLQPVATVESYDPATDTWSTLPPLPQPRTGAKAVVFGGRLLVGGAPFQTTGGSPSIDVYDPAANAWTTVPMPDNAGSGLATDGHTVWSISGGVLHATGDPAGGAWRRLTDGTVQTLHGSAGVFVGGRIVVLTDTATHRYQPADELR